MRQRGVDGARHRHTQAASTDCEAIFAATPNATAAAQGGSTEPRAIATNGATNNAAKQRSASATTGAAILSESCPLAAAAALKMTLGSDSPEPTHPPDTGKAAAPQAATRSRLGRAAGDGDGGGRPLCKSGSPAAAAAAQIGAQGIATVREGAGVTNARATEEVAGVAPALGAASRRAPLLRTAVPPGGNGGRAPRLEAAAATAEATDGLFGWRPRIDCGLQRSQWFIGGFRVVLSPQSLQRDQVIEPLGAPTPARRVTDWGAPRRLS
jgi:hypothetical protein